jgi:hypothetical protein
MNIEKINSRIEFFNEYLLADTTKMELNDKATYLEELSAYQAECNTMVIETKNAVLLSKALSKEEQINLKVFSNTVSGCYTNFSTRIKAIISSMAADKVLIQNR